MSAIPPGSAVPQIDPRGPRFGAAITAVLLTATLILGPGSPVGVALLLIQTVAFGLGALVGLDAQPWGIAYRRLVRPRLKPPAELEDPRPPRFAQGVGLVFALLAVAGLLPALTPLFFVATGFALFAAVLNAVFGFCLGCEVYLLGARLRGRSRAASTRG
ncbi:MAG TPA: DUF4395 domain-containing protein [Arachnia sp.]|nr:DUF4395 domain-containing protein [Arachnia sp.]HMT87470.1 DUF4395 domain-containing protein [Arachnia sp.]